MAKKKPRAEQEKEVLQTMNSLAALVGVEAVRESLELFKLGFPRHIIVSRIMQRFTARFAPHREEKAAPVVDLLSWRQSRPRPIKKGGKR